MQGKWVESAVYAILGEIDEAWWNGWKERDSRLLPKRSAHLRAYCADRKRGSDGRRKSRSSPLRPHRYSTWKGNTS